jgi:hypothetical protein
MKSPMSRNIIVKYVNPWKFRREQNQQRLRTLRQRDGENCSRCRRPLRFDLPDGHDLGPKIEELVTTSAGENESLDNLCLTHGRCNAKDSHDTAEVKERVRLKNEAALFVKARSRRRA